MPGYAQAQQQIDQNSANMVNNVQRNSNSSSDILASAGMAQSMANRSLSDLVRMNSQDKARRRGVHLQALGQLGREQNQAFQTNEMQPYQEANATKSALFSGGMQTLGDAAATYGGYKQAQLGQQKPQPTARTYQAPPTLSQLANGGSDFSLSRIERYLRSQNGY